LEKVDLERDVAGEASCRKKELEEIDTRDVD